MKKITLFILISSSLLGLGQKPLKIKDKNFNKKGLVVDNNGKLYTGEAIEILKISFFKNEGYLKGKVNNGDISGLWEFYQKKELAGYHYFKNNGNITYAFQKDGTLDWIELLENEWNKLTEIKVGDGKTIEKLYIIDYNKDGSKKNTFEYITNQDDYYDVVVADYDYSTQTVLDYFENNANEQEIVIHDFNKKHELIALNSKNKQITQIFLLGDLLESPEDAHYSLDKGFFASFTDLQDKNNFKLTLLKEKEPIFEIIVVNGMIETFDKVLNKKSVMLLYTHEDGFVPNEQEKIKKEIDKAAIEVKNISLKK